MTYSYKKSTHERIAIGVGSTKIYFKIGFVAYKCRIMSRELKIKSMLCYIIGIGIKAYFLTKELMIAANVKSWFRV